MAKKLKVSDCKPASPRGTRTAKLRQYISDLGTDDAAPLKDITEDIGLNYRYGYGVARELGAVMSLMVDGESVVCVLNPKTVKRLRNAKKD